MVDLRNKMFGFGNKGPKRKICPVIPPTVRIKMVGEGDKMATISEIAPIVCFGEDCEFFCETHEMCMHKCEHLEIVHGFGVIEEDDEEEGG